MKINIALLGMACFWGVHAQSQTIYLGDYLAPGAVDAVPAVRKALEDVRDKRATKLVLPGGELRLRPDMAVEKYQFISNNSESLKRIAFDLAGIDNLTIDGNGTKLIFSGYISPFNLDSCRNITIGNLSIDYTRTFHSEGTVTNVFDGGFDVTFPDDYIVDVEFGKLRFKDKDGVEYPYGSMLEFDVNRREPAYYVNDLAVKCAEPIVRNQDGSFRFIGKDKKATPGNIMVFGALSRINPAFTLTDCAGVTLRNVDLYHCCGMGVIAQTSRDIELNDFNVLPAEGRMISITADATHFANCAGYIRMIDCTFKNQKDDATNIHGLYMAVDSVTAPDKLLVSWKHHQQAGVEFIRPGMTLELVDNRNLNTYARREVKAVNRLNKIYTEVTFTEPLPDGVRKRHIVAADGEYPDVLISGCRFSGNRARGLLLGSRGAIVVEDCYFHNPGAAILFEGDGNLWWEQSGVRDVVIRNNVFENCNYGSAGWGKACIAVGTRVPEKADCRYHRNIRVEGNTFKVFDPRIAHLYCVDGFEFTPDNRIEPTADYIYARDETRPFVITDSDNIKIQ